jgi:hypothetical protein
MQTFHEDVWQTFVFCFLVAAGIIQIMVACRGWHGLSISGGRVRKNVNYALGAGLIIFGYAWYFSDPMHRNTRNIEGVMSIVCLVLGAAVAALLTALIASGADGIRRRRGGGEGARGLQGLKRIVLDGGEALLSSWGRPGENLVALAEPGSEKLLARIFSALPAGRGFLAVMPASPLRPQANPPGESELPDLLRQLEEGEGLDLGGEVFMGLGWGSNRLVSQQRNLEETYRPKAFLVVAPVIPDAEAKMLGDAFVSNNPFDIARVLIFQKPWREKEFKSILKIWLPIFIVCVAITTAVTVAFDVRWKLVFGPAAGLVLSLWVAYFAIARRGFEPGSGKAEAALASSLSSLPSPGGSRPAVTVLTFEECLSFERLPEDIRSLSGGTIKFWKHVLRGKFLLEEGTLHNLLNLIWGEEEQG